MKTFSLPFAALAFRLTDAYLVNPPGAAAPGTTSDCSGWVQSSSALTCEIIEQKYGMTEVQFVSWNPSVNMLGSGCNLISGLYYCVQVDFVTISASHSTPPPTSTTSRSTTTTSVGNGITTPTPIQAGMVTNCNKFYYVVSGDGCFDIAADNGIALDDFYAWNPAVKTDCSGLWPDYYVCIGTTTGTKPTSTSILKTTTTSSGNGIATPTPTQAGMVKNCNKFYDVVSGDGCYDIAADNGIALNDFYAWNPAVKTDCSGLWPDYYVCVGTTGTKPTSTTLKTTTTKSGNGIPTPTPTQAGMVKNCDKFYYVVSGDGCYDIAADNNIALNDFYAWNPAVKTDCSGLWPDYYVCVGIRT
ncbi:carbohydrate-binding module family 50 protein [Trichoderma gracile]